MINMDIKTTYELIIKISKARHYKGEAIHES